MQKKRLRILISAAAILVVLAGAVTYFYAGSIRGANATSPTGVPQFSKMQQRLLSGFASSEMALSSSSNNALTRATSRGNYFPTSDSGCSQNLGNNIKVNQNCLNISDADLQGRGQSQNETAIAQDPNNSNHIVASFNDYRRGDGNCYGAYSLNGGQEWTDTTIPMSFTRGTTFGAAREYWQAGGDTAVAWDTKGNVYFQCQMFQRGLGTSPNPDLSSAVYVFRSTGNFGASWNFPARPVIESSDTAGTGLAPFEDKPYMTVDNHKGSPFQDRVYVTWTTFAADGTAYIYESYSADYGEHFSAPVVVSTTSALCSNTFGVPTPQGTCNENQFSDPFTGPDGALYVVWANYNNAVTGLDNRNQMLLAKSIDGGQTFSAPVKVGDYYDLPDCATYQGGQDAGRACVPEKGTSMHSVFRATNYPSGAVNPRKPDQIVVNYGSYINRYSNESNGCAPAGFSVFGTNLYTGVKTPGACNNDILISVSNDGGASFTGTTKDPRVMTSITSGFRQRTTDQFWQWTSFSSSGRLAVSYFDRQYGQDELNGYSDISVTGVDDPYTEFHSTRATSSSMPFPTQFPDTQGNSLFYGDYSGLSASDGVAHPLWMDTRSPDLFLCPGTGAPGVPPSICKLVGTSGIFDNDQDAFTATLEIPG
jgi:hypothetical protein